MPRVRSRASAACPSRWDGRTSLADQAIGIELVNRAYCHRSSIDTGIGIVATADAAIPAIIDESTAIPDIGSASICFYPDHAESRFPRQRLHRLGFGAWYDDETVIRYWERFMLQPLPLRNVQRALRVYGYGIEVTGELDSGRGTSCAPSRCTSVHRKPTEGL